ncbi:OstA-like protein [Postechiella marina]|uniref:OstA-like protein n=1 Tax=Postechiella marina TaxID=943941 RepID=UPI0031D8FAE3
MKIPNHIYIILFFCFIGASLTQVKAQKKIEIKYSGFLNFDEKAYPGAKILTRDDAEQVHIVHEGGNLWCDKAFYYGKENFLEAYGNVKLVQGDTINLTSKYVEYNGDTQLAFASGNVVLESPDSTISTDTLYFDRIKQQSFYRNNGTVVKDTTLTITSKIGRYYMENKLLKFVDSVTLKGEDAIIKSNYFDYYEDLGHAYLFGPSTITTEESTTYCEKGFYDTENKIGYALKNAKIDYDNREILGDSLYFDNNRSFASATNNIKVTDTLNNSVIKGHYAEVFKAKDSLFITKRAVAITVQEKDSIYIHADKIMVTGKPDNRIAKAYYNAKIYKTDLSGRADSIYSNQTTGLTKLINISKGSGDAFSTKRKPILWNNDNQITGDTIHLKSNTEKEKLDSLIVFNNAFLISKDTLGTGYNQINGMKLIGLFNDENALHHVDIIKNAQSIYYFRNDENELVGIDKSKSGSIEIEIVDNEVDEIKKLNQVDGNIYPESKFPKIEAILKGFDWRAEERLKSVDDLFKDDPPLVLPTIKGLEDYVPQDNFFDEDMLDRIDKAGNRINTLPITINKYKEQENVLKYANQFDKKEWLKSKITITPNFTTAPDGNKTADKLIYKGDKFGYLRQSFVIKEDNYSFSIWLKGKGEIVIASRSILGTITKKPTLNVKLTDNWKKYTVKINKLGANAKYDVILSSIDKDDLVYSWGASVYQNNLR